MTKLTKAQKRVYDQMIRDGSFACVDTYRPADALVRLGLAKRTQRPFGTMIITPNDAEAAQ